MAKTKQVVENKDIYVIVNKVGFGIYYDKEDYDCDNQRGSRSNSDEQFDISYSELENTCSMLELTGFDFDNYNALVKKIGLVNTRKAYDLFFKYNAHAWIYNINYKRGSREYNTLLELGFQPVHFYKGTKSVITMMR